MSKVIGSDFIVEEHRPRKVYCSECDIEIERGESALVSMKDGKVMKRVCGEECRLTFDARYWQEVARKRRRP